MNILELIGRSGWALLGYPGLLTLLLLTSLLAATLRQPRAVVQGMGALLRGAWWQDERLWLGLSMLAAAVGMALLPMPLNPIRPTVVAWWWAWLAFEVAFLLPLLPALLTTHPPLARAALREVQVGVSGRAILWLALGVSLILYDVWSVQDAQGHSPLLGHALAILAASLTFPAAVGWGSFAPPTTLTANASRHGLPMPLAQAAAAAHLVRVSALLLASLVCLLPMSQVAVPVGIGMLLVSFALGCGWLAWQQAQAIQLPLTLALQRCWWRAFPLALMAVIYLSVLR